MGIRLDVQKVIAGLTEALSGYLKELRSIMSRRLLLNYSRVCLGIRLGIRY
jgi:hypothetical protein